MRMRFILHGFLLLSTSGSMLFAQQQKTTKVVDPIETKIEILLSKMTLEEKLGQMNQMNYFFTEKPVPDAIRAGKVGSLLNPICIGCPDPDVKAVNELQRIAVEESRLGIPILMERDVIHGFRTVFPLPLGQAATFNTDLVRDGARVAAIESRASGIHVTFTPMLDISRDPRWGRIAESLGEDPYLTGILGAAMVKGFQTDDLKNPTAIGATAKHFIGYGAAEGGRDYNSTNIPAHLMRNVYLPPFKEAIKAGAVSVMTSFNDNDGIPATGDKYLLRDLLRKEMRFDGFVVTDWNSGKEMIAHGFARDDKHVAELMA
ncbi:MAG: hypothetical protein RL662_710, partial [Bacteroidota bacterium]